MKKTIGLMLVVRNEGHRIKECLEWHLPYVDQVVLCDQQSSDNTLEIAQKCFEAWGGDWQILNDKDWGYCEPSKQKTADLLITDWILYVDPDEKFPKLFLEGMHKLIETEEWDGFIFPRYNFFDVTIFDNNVPIEPKMMRIQHPKKDPQLRLTRRSVSKFPEFLHHRVRILNEKGEKRQFVLPYPIEHVKTIRDQWDDNRRYKAVNHKEVVK